MYTKKTCIYANKLIDINTEYNGSTAQPGFQSYITQLPTFSNLHEEFHVGRILQLH